MCRLFLVIADTTNLIADLRVEGRLQQRLVHARARPPVVDLCYRSFAGLLHHLLTERIALLALEFLQMLSLQVGMRSENAVRSVGTEHIKVTIPKPAFALVEHIECFRLVLFHRSHCSLKHGLGGGVLSCRDRVKDVFNLVEGVRLYTGEMASKR